MATKPLALNESLNTTEQTPRNVADVLLEGLANVVEAIGNGGGIGMCNSVDPFSFAYVVTTNTGFKVETGRYLSIVFSVNNFWYDGVHALRLSVNNQLYEVKINGESPVTGKTYVKVDDAGIFVYDGTYFQLIRTSGGGHSIIDSEGNTMPQETAMQFTDSFVSDDDVNGITIVENIKEVDPADYDSTIDEGIIVCDDGNDVPIGEIEEDSVTVTSTGSDNKNWGDLLLELRNEIDISKVTEFSYLILNDSLIYSLYRLSDFTFTWISLTGGGQYDIESIRLSSSPNIVENYNGTITNRTNTLITNSQKLTLYYGTSSGVINLLTDARHCMMSDGVTSVEDEIGRNCHKALTFTASTTYDNVKDLIDFSRNPYLKFNYNSRTILCHLYRQGTGTFDFMSLGALVSESYLVRFGSTGLTVYAYNDTGSTTTTITSSITDAVLYY